MLLRQGVAPYQAVNQCASCLSWRLIIHMARRVCTDLGYCETAGCLASPAWLRPSEVPAMAFVPVESAETESFNAVEVESNTFD